MLRGASLASPVGADAIKKVEPAVQSLNSGPRRATLPKGVDWDDLRYLVEVKEAGSLREAARRLKVAVNTVRARLARLEQATGSPILRRELTGVQLTEAGGRLYGAAIRLSNARLSDADDESNALIDPATLAIGCTEGIGTSWLTPRVAELARRVAPVAINLEYDYDLQKDRSATVDIGLAYRPPLSNDLVVAKLATIHFMFFASPAYLATRGMPTSIEALREHSFVEQGGPGYNSSAIDLLLGSDRPANSTCIRTNSSLTQAYAVANGAGVALLPSYTRAVTSAIVPLPILPQFRIPVSYYFREEARRCKVVRTAIDWLKEAFDPEAYPWFGDRFVHPDDFPQKRVQEARVVSMFQHFLDQVVT